MPDLTIRIKKKNDGSAALSCTRADGSVTWQRQEGQLGRFFPLHDLTHYCVESVLGFDRGFYGLLAAGWDISDFGKPESRGQDFSQAGLVEVIVGMFDLERMTGERGDAEDMATKIASYYESRNLPQPNVAITQGQIEQVRALRAVRFERWRELAGGDTMELEYNRQSAQPSRADTKPRVRA
jgi:hypothetical protein